MICCAGCCTVRFPGPGGYGSGVPHGSEGEGLEIGRPQGLGRSIWRKLMNDPHVVMLVYKIEHDSSVNYREEAPFDYKEENFSLRVQDGHILFVMKAHYATEEEAQEAVRAYIDRWEFAVGLEKGPGKFKLLGLGVQIEDRRPSPNSDEVLYVPLIIEGGGGRILGMVPPPSQQYPIPPPPGLAITPDVQSMYERFMCYRVGREPLPSMAYFCLTVLQGAAGGREAAAKKYGIALEVLRKIGDLSSNKGGSQARKASGISDDLTPLETRFLEKAVPALIRQAAEVEHDPTKSRDEIELSDFCP